MIYKTFCSKSTPSLYKVQKRGRILQLFVICVRKSRARSSKIRMGERSENLFVISNSKKFLVVGGWVSCLGTIPWPQSQKDWPKNVTQPKSLRPHIYAQSRRSTSWQHFQCGPNAIKFLPEVTGRRPNRGRAWPPPAPFCDTLNILKSGSVHDIYTFRLL
jgi:hypothetical protein